MPTTSRYYAYGEHIGRMRIPTPINVPARWNEEQDAIEWAAGRGADNVVREDGPASKPTSITLVWKRPTDAFAPRLEDLVFAELLARFPDFPARHLGDAAKAITNLVKEH